MGGLLAKSLKGGNLRRRFARIVKKPNRTAFDRRFIRFRNPKLAIRPSRGLTHASQGQLQRPIKTGGGTHHLTDIEQQPRFFLRPLAFENFCGALAHRPFEFCIHLGQFAGFNFHRIHHLIVAIGNFSGFGEWFFGGAQAEVLGFRLFVHHLEQLVHLRFGLVFGNVESQIFFFRGHSQGKERVNQTQGQITQPKCPHQGHSDASKLNPQLRVTAHPRSHHIRSPEESHG